MNKSLLNLNRAYAFSVHFSAYSKETDDEDDAYRLVPYTPPSPVFTKQTSDVASRASVVEDSFQTVSLTDDQTARSDDERVLEKSKPPLKVSEQGGSDNRKRRWLLGLILLPLLPVLGNFLSNHSSNDSQAHRGTTTLQSVPFDVSTTIAGTLPISTAPSVTEPPAAETSLPPETAPPVETQPPVETTVPETVPPTTPNTAPPLTTAAPAPVLTPKRVPNVVLTSDNINEIMALSAYKNADKTLLAAWRPLYTQTFSDFRAFMALAAVNRAPGIGVMTGFKDNADRFLRGEPLVGNSRMSSNKLQEHFEHIYEEAVYLVNLTES